MQLHCSWALCLAVLTGLASCQQELLSTISCSAEERSALATCGRSLGIFQQPLSQIHRGTLAEMRARSAALAKTFVDSCPHTETLKFCAAKRIAPTSTCQVSSCFMRGCDSLKGQPLKELYARDSLLCAFRLLSTKAFAACVRRIFPHNARQLPLESLATLVPELVECVEPGALRHCGPSVVDLLHLIDPASGLCLVDFGQDFLAPPGFPLPKSIRPSPFPVDDSRDGDLFVLEPPQQPSRLFSPPRAFSPPGPRFSPPSPSLSPPAPHRSADPTPRHFNLPSPRLFTFALKEAKDPSVEEGFPAIPGSAASVDLPSQLSEKPMPREESPSPASTSHTSTEGRRLPRPQPLAPEPAAFDCEDHEGRRYRRGEEFPDEEGAFLLRCLGRGLEAQIVACLDGEGEKRKEGQRWRTKDGFFVNACHLGPGPATHKTVACLTAQKEEVGNGSDWLVGRFYQRCVLDPLGSGWSFIKVVACEDDYGNRVVNGTEWPSQEFMYYRRCALDTGDGQNRIVTVACTDETGRRIEDGASWTSADGRFRKTCRIDLEEGSGEIESEPLTAVAKKSDLRGCLDDEGALVSNGSEWAVASGRFLKACVLRDGRAFVPVVACVDDAGQRVANGTEWPSLDFLYFQKCHLDSGDGRNRIFTVGCADDEKRKRPNGHVWLSSDGARKKCVLDNDLGTGQIEVVDFAARVDAAEPPPRAKAQARPRPKAVCSLDDGRRFLNATEWLMDNRRFYKQCIVGSGWFNTPVVACVDDLGNRVPNGTVFPTVDFLYFQRCQLADAQGLNRIFTIACADEEGRQVPHLGEWTAASGVRKRCVLDAVKGTGQIQLIRTRSQAPRRRSPTPNAALAKRSEDNLKRELRKWALELAEEATCIDDATGRVLENGTEWLPTGGRFFKRCVVESGWSYVAVVGCVDEFGNRVPNGTVWPTRDLLYFQRCQLDSGDGLNRIFTVGCADDSGTRREDGSEWLSSDGRTRKRCVINHFNGTGQIEVFPNLSPETAVLASGQGRRRGRRQRQQRRLRASRGLQARA